MMLRTRAPSLPAFSAVSCRLYVLAQCHLAAGRSFKSARTMRMASARGLGAAGNDGDARWEKDLLSIFNDKAPIARSLGMKLSFDQDRSAIISLAPNAQLTSAARPPRQTGMLHGGMYGVIADTAGWFASARSRSPGAWPLTSTLTLHFSRAVEARQLLARGRVRAASARQDICEVSVEDDSGARVAFATVVFAVTASPKPDGTRAQP